MKKTVLRSYARLIARCGVNVQKGQEVFISAGLDQPEFVAMVVDECYKAGAKKVVVDWHYQPLTRLHVRHQSQKTMNELSNYEEARLQHFVDVIPCRIHLISDDPDGMKGVNQLKLVKARQAQYPIVRKYNDQLENQYQWCIAAVPGKAWAKKLFPGMTAHQAEEKLWEAILSTSRVDEDPIAAWDQHNRDLEARCKYLNDLRIASLHYTSANGTDFTVGLIEQGRFCGGGETSRQNIFFNPNIPSEECFTSPKRGEADGWVVATKPLSYMGELIDNFAIRFENGKAVEWKAEKGKELLDKMITMDEGAAYLGECALVPFNSPINNSGILFYNTLFDENACCHLALGRGFMDALQGFENLTKEEGNALGVNDSMIHVDFMIGSADMKIEATCFDGSKKLIFENGNWAF